MARPWIHGASAYLSLSLLLLLPAAAMATSMTYYSSYCKYPVPAQDKKLTGTLMLPWIPTAYFSGGQDLGFAPDNQSYIRRSFSYSHLPGRPTADPAVTHVSGTVTLEGTRRVRSGYLHPHSVTFSLEGYFSTATSTAELCMVGTGSYAKEDGSGVVLLSGAVLQLHLPHPANLSRPFVTGTLGGDRFHDVSLVGYGTYYEYGQAASCPPPPAAVRGTQQALQAAFSCHRLRALLQSSYSVEYKLTEKGNAATATSFPLRLGHRRMYVNQMDCDDHGAVRAYMVLYTNQSDALASNYLARWSHQFLAEDEEPQTKHWRRRWWDGNQLFLVGDEALVADGFWDEARGQLCLKACRVASSGRSRADLQVRECGIGVSFWFPAVWSIRDRSFATGIIWNTSGNSDVGNVISVSRTVSYRGSLAGVGYNYTRVEEATKHYDSLPELSKERKGRFPGNYSYRDFAFQFIMEKQWLPGHAWPVTIGSALVEGDELMADAAFSLHGTAEVNKQSLLNVSYNLEYQVASVNQSLPDTNFSPPEISRISAEGVYDTRTGSLCMVACQVTNSSSDCEVLVTFQFAPVNSVERERAVGTIRSLREQSDPLFFKTMDFVVHGTSVEEEEESISRMDMESIMLVVSMALSCVFTALQLRHVSKHPEALPATSITMLVILALGYVIPLVLNLEDMYADSRRRQYILQLTSGGSLDLNELMLRASTMLAFVLQLRLLHLALSRTPTGQEAAGSKREGSPSPSDDAERSTLWICLPLYVLGAVVVWIVHMSDNGLHHGLRVSALPAPSGPALVDDLAAYAGLVLDGFLLPQVVRNALSGSRVRALSPWFYAGGTVVRAAPHVYDVYRKRSYAPSWRRSYVYASPRDDLFGVAWDIAIPCGAALLATLLFLQQWLGGAFLCCWKSRRPGSVEYEMVSTLSSS